MVLQLQALILSVFLTGATNVMTLPAVPSLISGGGTDETTALILEAATNVIAVY